MINEDYDEEELFDLLLSSKSAMTKIENLLPVQKNKKLQRPAKPESFYTLEKTDKYSLRNYITKELKVPDGLYIFIIAVDDPHTVFCARSIRDSNYHWHDAVDGHTSIGCRKPVRYAGALLFRRGELLRWTNASGHYLPPMDLRYLMVPYIKRLLPDEKFFDTSFNAYN